MALKELLVHVDQSEASHARLRLAASLARRHGSRLIALCVREWTPRQLGRRTAGEAGLLPAEEIDRLDRSTEATIDAAVERLRRVLADLAKEQSLETDWRCVDGPAATVVPQHARYADLCILGQDPEGNGGPIGYTFSEEMLFVSGRPTLFVPTSGSFETLGRHIAVAWNTSRPAARALNDAMSLIERAERISVLSVNPEQFIEKYGALPTDQLVDHLERHGATVNSVPIDRPGPNETIADALQQKARTIGADMLVAGAFGHARLWEKFLGGVTQDLLDSMTLPILMAH